MPNIRDYPCRECKGKGSWYLPHVDATGLYSPVMKCCACEGSGIDYDILKLIEALKGLKINNECWCDKAIGSPMLVEHTDACIKAKEALELWKGKQS